MYQQPPLLPTPCICRDELRDDDVALKLNSIRRLGTIALALGDERTRSELLPYLLESKPEEDELMVALAEEVGKLVQHVGGPSHAHCLVPLLEDLARQDETVVREAAVKSLQIVGKDFNDEQAMTHLVPCIKVCPPACTTVAVVRWCLSWFVHRTVRVCPERRKQCAAHAEVASG
jgi:serine/threonine-protein phosphatase 2A regulatory subunit A